MPINMTINLLGSVGAKGDNKPDDVRAVQRQLNAHMNPPRLALTVDGVSGKKTEGTIRDFQRCVLGFTYPDGRVDPRGKTQSALNNPASEGKWAGMSMAPADYTPAPSQSPGGAGTGGAPKLALSFDMPSNAQASFDMVWHAVHTKKMLAGDQPSEKVCKTVLDCYVQNELPDQKTAHAILDLLKTALVEGKLQNFAKGLKILSDLNYGNPQAFCKALGDLAKSQGALKTIRCIAAAGMNPRFAGVLRGAGTLAAGIGILFCVMEAKNYFDKGLYGPCVKELYKGTMALAVLPVAIVDAVVTAWQGLDPGVASRSDGNVFFEILRHGNLLDHGGNALDSAVTIVEVCIKAVRSGKMDMQMLEALVERMRNSSGRNFVELGEFLGDWYYDRLVDAGKLGEDIGDYIGREYGRHLLPLIKYFDL